MTLTSRLWTRSPRIGRRTVSVLEVRDLPVEFFGNTVVEGAIEGDFGNDAGDAGHGGRGF